MLPRAARQMTGGRSERAERVSLPQSRRDDLRLRLSSGREWRPLCPHSAIRGQEDRCARRGYMPAWRPRRHNPARHDRRGRRPQVRMQTRPHGARAVRVSLRRRRMDAGGMEAVAMTQATIASQLLVVVAGAFAVVPASARATDHAPQSADVGPGCLVLRYSPRHTAGSRAPTLGVALKAKPTCSRTEASGKCCLRRSSQSARTITQLPIACPGTAAANNPLTVASSTWAPFGRLRGDLATPLRVRPF